MRGGPGRAEGNGAYVSSLLPTGLRVVEYRDMYHIRPMSTAHKFNHLRSVLGLTALLVASGVAGCGDRGTTAELPVAGPAASPREMLRESFAARAIVRRARETFRIGEVSALASSEVEGFTAKGGRVEAQLALTRLRGTARASNVSHGSRASDAIDLSDRETGARALVTLEGATDARAERGDGYLVYRGGHHGNADVLERVTAEGTEDSIVFDQAPAGSEVAYALTLGSGIAGLRLVSNTLELLDAGGVPRLRMATPYVIDATKNVAWPNVSVRGCAVDQSPAAPWGRAVTRPGDSHCTVHISWSGVPLTYPVLLDPTWSTTGGLASARSGPTVSVLPDGRVLVTGGSGGSTALATAELFDPPTGTWAAVGTMTSARQLHTATILADGTVLVAGGRVSRSTADTALASTEVYDPTTGQWTAQGDMLEGRAGFTANLLPGGAVLVAGGSNAAGVRASAELYDATNGTWSTTGSMPFAHEAHTANVLPDGRVLVTGGWDATANASPRAELYVPNTRTWSSARPPAVARGLHTATVLRDGRVLVVGGSAAATTPAISSAELFNPRPGTWSAAASLPGGRAQQTATLLSDGRLLVAGGQDDTLVRRAAASAYAFDEAAGTWSSQGAMLQRRASHAATLLKDGRVLLVAGALDGAALATAEIYDPASQLDCSSPLPQRLACTGLYSNWATRTISPTARAFDPGLHLWSDGATKRRWIEIPPGTRITTSDMNEWTFPVGTKVWKEFSLAGKTIETRFMWKTSPTEWFRTTYRWSANGEAAEELTTGEQNVDGTTYEVPSQDDCGVCHRGRIDNVLGFEAVGLSSMAASGLTMSALVAQDLVTNAPAETLTVPGNATESTALGWLHANCGTGCHNGSPNALAGWTGLRMRLNAGQLTAVAATETYTTAVNVRTVSFTTLPPPGDPNLSLFRILPGNLTQSMIPWRDKQRGVTGPAAIQMPPLATHVVDVAGVASVEAWVMSL